MGTTFFFEVPIASDVGRRHERLFGGSWSLSDGTEHHSRSLLQEGLRPQEHIHILSRTYSLIRKSPKISPRIVEEEEDRAAEKDERGCAARGEGKEEKIFYPPHSAPQEVLLEKLAFQTVLIVDDAATNRKMLRLLLGRRRYETEEAEDGLQGVQMVKQRIDRGIVPYDAIIMDFIMPNMDGPTATARIRSLGYTGVIVGVTGNAMQNDIQTFLGKGADKVLIKPLDIDEFIAAVIGKRNVIIV